MEQDIDDLVVSSSDNLIENLPNTSTPDSKSQSMRISVGTSFPETSVGYVETTTISKEPSTASSDGLPKDILQFPQPSVSVQTIHSENDSTNTSLNECRYSKTGINVASQGLCSSINLSSFFFVKLINDLKTNFTKRTSNFFVKHANKFENQLKVEKKRFSTCFLSI